MDDVTFLFGGWAAVLRVVFITITGYTALLLILRAAGTRTLAQMKAFDFVITVTLGSAFGRVVTATEVGLTEAVAGFATLAGLQLAFAAMHARFRIARSLATPGPTLLYHDGEFVTEGLRRHRFQPADLDSVVRQQGMGSLEDVRTIVLEADGSFAVVKASQFGDGSVVPVSSR